MSEVADNLSTVTGKIADACERVGRDVKTVELIAVSKTFPAASVRDAFDAGQLVFGRPQKARA